MKLKDFLKEFEGMDSESEVYINMSVGCCGDTEALSAPQIWDEALLDKGNFLSSCRKYANASVPVQGGPNCRSEEA